MGILKEEIEKNRKKYWDEVRTPFIEPYDVPNLPIVDSDEWKNFYVPILIERGAIPKNKLIVGKQYLGECRNANVATWDGEKFIYKRNKFNFVFDEKINHFEDDDGYDLFVPIRELADGEEVDEN